jgi:hypothetical protein
MQSVGFNCLGIGMDQNRKSFFKQQIILFDLTHTNEKEGRHSPNEIETGRRIMDLRVRRHDDNSYTFLEEN